MKSRIKLLKTMFYLPVAIAAVRCLLTLVILVGNPQNMSFRFFQIFPLGILLFSMFTYMKLYSDGDPVITLMLPTIIQFLAIFIFKRKLEIVPFILPLMLDIIFLVVKGIKATSFPFEIEGEDSLEDDFQDLELED